MYQDSEGDWYNDDGSRADGGTIEDAGNVQPGADEQVPNEPPAALTPRQGDPSHVYVGRDSRGDVWQMFDGFQVLEWAVSPGDDSRNIIPSTLAGLGPPSSMSVAQGPSPTTTTPPAGSVQPITPTVTTPPPVINQDGATPHGAAISPRHKYVGRDARGDVWQLFDGSNVIEWAVPVGSDSGAIIPSTTRNLGAPSSMTIAKDDGFRVDAPPTSTTTVATPPSAGSVQPLPQTPTTTTTTMNQGNTTPHGAAISTRHKYVGRDTRGDVWQIFDGHDVIEWAVPPGANSGEIIPGSTRNLGAPSAMTVAQDDGLRVDPPAPTTTTTSTAAGSPAGSVGVLAIIGVAAQVLGAFK